jgi:hypothetical protein
LRFDYTLVLIDILQTALLADPLELPPELFHFERFQSLDFFAFLEELSLFTGFSSLPGFLTCRILATDGGSGVT